MSSKKNISNSITLHFRWFRFIHPSTNLAMTFCTNHILKSSKSSLLHLRTMSHPNLRCIKSYLVPPKVYSYRPHCMNSNYKEYTSYMQDQNEEIA